MARCSRQTAGLRVIREAGPRAPAPTSRRHGVSRAQLSPPRERGTGRAAGAGTLRRGRAHALTEASTRSRRSPSACPTRVVLPAHGAALPRADDPVAGRGVDRDPEKARKPAARPPAPARRPLLRAALTEGVEKHRVEGVVVRRVLRARRPSPTASSTATRSASTWRSRRCATSAAAIAAARPSSPGSPHLPGVARHAALSGRDRVTGKTEPAGLRRRAAARTARRQTGDDYQTLLTRYCARAVPLPPRRVDRRERFVLKGAMLLRALGGSTLPARRATSTSLRLAATARSRPSATTSARSATRRSSPTPSCFDVERHRRRGDPRRGRVRRARASRCPPDAARRASPADRHRASAMRSGRRRRRAVSDAARLPRAGSSPIRREAVVAEKLEAMVVARRPQQPHQGLLRPPPSREHFEFDRATLVRGRAARRFERRAPRSPPKTRSGSRPVYWENPSRPAQVRAFARRAAARCCRRSRQRSSLACCTRSFRPCWRTCATATRRDGTWRAGGPWR